jgi:hypothetical protein
MGRDDPDYDGHVRQRVGRQVRSCRRSLYGYHPSGTFSMAQTLPVSQHLHQIALFVIGVAGGLSHVPTVIVS